MVGRTRRDTAAKAGPFDRWAGLWSVLFYGVLLGATFSALSYGSHSGAEIALIVGLVSIFGVWHALWRRSLLPHDQTYLVGAVLLWVGLVLLDPDFLLLSLVVFVPVCYQHLVWGSVAILGTGAIWVWLQAQEQGTIPWDAVVTATPFVVAGLLLVGYVRAVVRQSGERQRFIEDLRSAQADLARAERQAGILEERHRLARDIHDTLTQGFTSIVMLLEATRASLDSDHPGRRHVERALQTARDNLAESRRLVWAMRPASLTDASVPDALQRLANQLGDETDMRVDTVLTGRPQPLAQEQETALLRIAQEALTNIRKHAKATEVTLTISYMDDVVVLDIHDNGVGFAPSTQTSGEGVGLSAMRERVQLLGGTVSVESDPGEGTTIVAHIPTTTDPHRAAVSEAP